MLQSLRRFGLAVFVLLSAVVSSEAALINISESSGGGSGTLVNDGQVDVGSNNGGGSGDALLLSQLGITNGNLLGGLDALALTGVFTDNDAFATTASLSTLWLIGTLTGNPLPACSTCGLLSDINVGAGISLPNGDKQNVLFVIPLVGAFGAVSGDFVGPANLAGPELIPTSFVPGPPNDVTRGTRTFELTTAQIAFIIGRMIDPTLSHNFGVNDVRLGLSVVAEGQFGTDGRTDIGSGWDFQAAAVAPEPATVLLLGTGLVAAAARRLRRRQRH